MDRVTRREFIGSTAATATTALVASHAVAAGSKKGYLWPLGVQLWSVIVELLKNFDGTLRQLVALGYQRVEAAGWMDRSPEVFRRSVEAANLVCDSAHVAMPELAADMRGSVSRVRDTGCRYLICASPQPPAPLAPGPDWMTALTKAMTLDAWKRNAELLNEAGSIASAAGIKLGYHNHAAEFATYDGQRAYDVLLAGTDPKLVLLEIDVAWAAAGGADPVELIRKNSGRVARLHLKDLPTRPPSGQMATSFATLPVGKGIIDWHAIFDTARQAKVGGTYVEVEFPHLRSPFSELADARDYLRTI